MTFIVQGRWFWTADRKRLVPASDPGARFLAYPHGTAVADFEAERMGLKPRPVPAAPEPPTPPAKRARGRPRKMTQPAENKMMPPPENK